MQTDYDVTVIGSGPAGLTAALFCARAGLKTVVFEEGTLGGAIVNVELVENYPSYPNGIPGSELSMNLVSQVMQHGVDFKLTSATGIEVLSGPYKRVKTDEGDFVSKAVIVAAGAVHKRLCIPGEDAFEGNGLSYCAYCDGNKFTGKEVAVIGGGDSGVTEALYLSRITEKVTLIEVLPALSASRTFCARVEGEPRIEILCSSAAEEITAEGGSRVLALRDVTSGLRRTVKVSGIFVRIGIAPQTEYLKDLLALDDLGFVTVDQQMETSVPGIFAPGDIRSGSPRQWVSAAGDGAVAGIAAERYITLANK